MPVLTEADLRQGAVVLSLIEDWGEWVHRRVEHVTLADPTISERRVSVDFTLALDPATPALPADGAQSRYLVPVTWIAKRRLTNFDLRDETNRALPVLTQMQAAKVATGVLAVAAAEIAQARLDLTERFFGRKLKTQWEPLPIDVLSDLWIIAVSKRRTALEKWNTLHLPPDTEAIGEDQLAESLRWRKAMTSDQEFMALASDIARNFLIFTPLAGRQGIRRIIKLSYDEQRTTARARRDAYLWEFQRFFGLRAKRIDVPASGVGLAQCFHLEVEVPEGIFLTRARLLGYPPDDVIPTNAGPVDDAERTPGRTYEEGNRLDREEDIVTWSSQCAHLHLADVPRSFAGAGVIALRMRGELVLRGAWINAAFTVALLVLVAAFLKSFELHIDATVALLLGVSGGVSLYLARPREPGMSAAMHSGVRLLALGNALAAFGAIAVVLAGGKCETNAKTTEQVCTTSSATEPALIVLAAIAGAMFLVLSMSLWYSRRPPEQRVVRERLHDASDGNRGFG